MSPFVRRSVDVAVVGGGLAGAAMATRLARRGLSVVVLDRARAWHWHACGVFSSPAAVAELRSLGLDERDIASVARPIPAMRVESMRRSVFRLTYGAEAHGTNDGDTAVGFDREALDRIVLDLAIGSGADVLRGHVVEAVEISRGRRAGSLTARGPNGTTVIGAGVIVGADGIRSVVAREVGVSRPARLGRRVGLTWHVQDPAGSALHDARMVVLDGAYCGLAPVPGGRLNVGIVLSGRDRLRALARHGAAHTGRQILDEALDHDPGAGWRHEPVDTIVGAAPLGHRVARRAGPGWLLVGDAAGFLDPFTGEGLNRALVSARLAAEVVAGRPGITGDLSAYDRAMRRRFAGKDLVSLMVQAFLARPAVFEYAARRLAGRERSRDTLGLVVGDLAPASRALDPRYVAALLAP